MSARPDLCGGYRVSGIPTAIENYRRSAARSSKASERQQNRRKRCPFRAFGFRGGFCVKGYEAYRAGATFGCGS
jgi:hypothetical protein